MSWKDYKSVSAAQKAGSMYFAGKDGKKQLAVTREQLDSWKERNKGKFKGSALTAWANAKGKDIGGDKPPSAPPARPTSKTPSAPPARPSSKRTSGGPAGGSTADRASGAKSTIESARTAVSDAKETLSSMGVSGRAARGGGYGEDIRPTLKDAIARVDDLTAKAQDDPRTYVDDLKRALNALRSIVRSGGLSRRDDKFKGLRSDGPLFEGMSGNSGTTGSRSRPETRMAKGGMAKKGYAKGGMVKANCGASMKPNRKAKK